mmetsp:Transcript_27836/g.91545  ORF Transcript_27836/g.91545 Transcript_27836/m.91545 type:complete len:284 (-) Transcript_27836:98-949(-)
MARRQPVRLLPRLRRLLLCHVLPVCRRGAAGAAVLADARRREGPKVQGDRRDPLRAVCVHQHLQQDLLGELHRCHSRVHAVRARDPRLLRRPDLRGRPATPSRRTRALALQSARGCLLRRLLSPDLLPPPRRSREDPPAAAHPALLLRRGDGRLLPRLLLHPLRDLPHHAPRPRHGHPGQPATRRLRVLLARGDHARRGRRRDADAPLVPSGRERADRTGRLIAPRARELSSRSVLPGGGLEGCERSASRSQHSGSKTPSLPSRCHIGPAFAFLILISFVCLC